MDGLDNAVDISPEFDGGAEVEQMTVIQEALNLLENYQREIQTVGGVSRAHVKALVDECGVELPASAPLNSFTADPSTTNIQVANEGLISAIAGKIKDLAKAVLALLRKIFDWVIDLLRKVRGNRANVERKLHNASVTADAAAQLHELNLEGVPLNPSATARVNALIKKREEIESRFDSIFSDLHADTVTGGQVAAKVRSILLYLPDIAGFYELRVEQYLKAAQAARDGDAASVGAFASIAQPESYPRLNALVGMIEIPKFTVGNQDVVAVSNALREHLRGLSLTRSFEPPSLSAILSLMGEKSQLGVSSFLNDTVIVKAMTKVNDALGHVMSHYNSLRDNTSLDNPVTQAEYAALKTLRDEGEAIRRLIECGTYIDVSQSMLINAVWDWWVADMNVFVERAKSADDETAGKAKSVANDLNRKLKR